MSVHADVIVIGGGIVGNATAYYLVPPGHQAPGAGAQVHG